MSDHHNLHTQGDTSIAERIVLIHKQDAEGALIVNALTGQIAQPIDERPEWSAGLAVALLGERINFYSSRLGPSFTEAQKFPQAIAFEDLGWLTTDDEGEVAETEASTEWRMDHLAEALGVDRTASIGSEDAAFDRGKGKVLAEVEIGMDRGRTEAEASALDEAQSADFGEDHKSANG